MNTLADTVQMICGECGIVFSVPAAFNRERRETGKSWYCPNGHSRVFRESEVDRLKQDLEDSRTALLTANRELITARGRVESLEKKAKRVTKRVSRAKK